LKVSSTEVQNNFGNLYNQQNRPCGYLSIPFFYIEFTSASLVVERLFILTDGIKRK